MNIVLFCHSLLSDWNHGNAHFLRGLVSELAALGHRVRTFEPEDAWSVRNLVADTGGLNTGEVLERYPALDVVRYASGRLDLQSATDGADLVVVHEWAEPAIVAALGNLRARQGASFRLLFHDTHHRSVTDKAGIAAYDLSGYDGVLAFGEAVRERYLAEGWARRAWVFHEAADARVFAPSPNVSPERDLCFVGNWGDGERTRELDEFLFRPAAELGLSGTIHGVRYPPEAVQTVEAAGLTYAGWLPNYRVPATFARHRLTVHVPRRPYAEALPGVPTIRVFEALACGIPLICAPWSDREGLFRAGDYLAVSDGAEAARAMRLLHNDASAAAEIARRGRETVLARHTCAHRAFELLGIARAIGVRDLSADAARDIVGTEVMAWE